MVQIWWGFRLFLDVGMLCLFSQYFALEPVYYFRHRKMEGVRYAQRRRPYLLNPYFSKPKEWMVKYDSRLRPMIA